MSTTTAAEVGDTGTINEDPHFLFMYGGTILLMKKDRLYLFKISIGEDFPDDPQHGVRISFNLAQQAWTFQSQGHHD